MEGDKEYVPNEEFLEQMAYLESLKPGDEDFYRKGDTDYLREIIREDIYKGKVPKSDLDIGFGIQKKF